MSLKEIEADKSSGNDSQFYFFGIVIDAAYPYKTNQGKFICSLKIVDHTFHHKNDH